LTLLLDTHVVAWSSLQPELLSASARQAIEDAEDLAVASITWYELAWLASHRRISLTIPLRAWFDDIARRVDTAHLTPAIAMIAVELSDSFPGDPQDRIIYATAVENGRALVSKDERMRSHPYPRQLVIW